jgi:uncharacterized protein (DUF2235 family)
VVRAGGIWYGGLREDRRRHSLFSPEQTQNAMPRNLVICCDGTNNEFGAENTNVVRLVQVLDRDPGKQLVYYDPGIGTLPEPGLLTRVGKRFSEYIDLAFGTGLKRKVEHAYSYLMDWWEPDDRVFLFGFSRGAYTVRVLAGLLHALGLLPRGHHNLVPYVMKLFAAVRKHVSSAEDSQWNYWKLCNQFRQTFARPVQEGSDNRSFAVHFLGVWDTVSSVGWVWDPVRFPFTAQNPSVKTIRHAVSIDERRWFFRQNLLQPSPDQDFRELWFPGVHADVGGGYPLADGALWRGPFEWILGEAESAHLCVDPERKQALLQKWAPSPRPWADMQHESLAKLWWLAEFFPKMTYQPGLKWRRPDIGLGRHRIIPEGALFHRSALLRIRETDYAPLNCSAVFFGRVRGLLDVPQALPYEP